MPEEIQCQLCKDEGLTGGHGIFEYRFGSCAVGQKRQSEEPNLCIEAEKQRQEQGKRFPALKGAR